MCMLYRKLGFESIGHAEKGHEIRQNDCNAYCKNQRSTVRKWTGPKRKIARYSPRHETGQAKHANLGNRRYLKQMPCIASQNQHRVEYQNCQQNRKCKLESKRQSDNQHAKKTLAPNVSVGFCSSRMTDPNQPATKCPGCCPHDQRSPKVGPPIAVGFQIKSPMSLLDIRP